jgi:DNA anti-recombination protein RmuC
LSGWVVGGFVVAVMALLARRGTAGSNVEAELVKRLEMIDRGLRDEFSAIARKQARRRRTARRIDQVARKHAIVVDLRLKQLQDDNSKQIDKMRATVDEKLQGTLEKTPRESFKL